MANSAVVGILRALLTADTAEFTTGLKRASDSAKAFERDWKKVGQQATQVGSALTKTITLPLAALGGSAVKAAMDFESSFAGVRKTVQATETEFKQMAQGFRDLAKTIPVNVNELNRLGEAAGALGIPKAEVVDFARVMALLGVTTNVTADQAAESIAKIQNIFGAAGKDTEQFASTLVALGNDGASTEDQILSMATRIAGAGNAINMTQGQVLAFASALSSVGIEAEMGGSAISRVFIDIAQTVNKGGTDLAKFAAAANMSVAEFSRLFKEDAAQAVNAFIVGLGDIKRSGGDLLGTLAELGFSEIRVRDTLLRAAGAGDLLTRALDLQKTAWRENSALSAEAGKRFETTASQLTLLWNRVKDVAISFGNALLPTIKSAIAALNELVPRLEAAVNAFVRLPVPVQQATVATLGLTAALGPALYVFGQLAIAASGIAGLFTAKGLATVALTKAFTGLTAAAGALLTPLGALAVAATLLVGWILNTTGALGKMWEGMKFSAGVVGDLTTVLAYFGGGVLMDLLLVVKDVAEWFGQRLVNAFNATINAARTVIPGFDLMVRALGYVIEKSQELAIKGRDAINEYAEAIREEMPKLASTARVSALQASLAFENWHRTLKSLATGQALQPITAGLELFNAELGLTPRAVSGAAGSIPSFTASLQSARAAVANLTNDQRANIRAGIELGVSIEDIANTLKLSKPVVELYGESLKKLAKSSEDSAKDLREFRNAIGEQEIADHAAALKTREEGEKQYRQFVNQLGEREIADHAAKLKAKEDLDRQYRDFRNEIGLRQMEDAAKQMVPRLGASLASSLGEAFAKMPSTILGAVQGGGNVGGAIGASLGGAVSEGLGKVVAGKVAAGTLSKSLGSLFGSALPIVGPLLGELGGKLIGKLFGGLFGGGEKKKVQEALAKLFEGAGGKGAFTELAKSAGVTDALLSKLFNATKLKDYESALRQITAQMERHNQELLEQQHLTDAQAQRQEMLNAAIARQKFSIEELGPALQKQQLAEQAEQILDDWKLLIGAGIDIKAVIREMSDEINEFVQNARRTGIEVPLAMRPIIEQMIAEGRLLDENGRAFERLEDVGITFGETLTEMFKGVLKKLDELIEKLNAAAQHRTGSITIDETVRRRVIEEGGGNAPSRGDEPERFHSGGIVAPRWSSMPRMLSDEVPIIAQTGEGILSRRGMAAFDDMNAGRLGGSDTMVAGAISTLSKQLAKRDVTLPTMIATAVRDELQLGRRR